MKKFSGFVFFISAFLLIFVSCNQKETRSQKAEKVSSQKEVFFALPVWKTFEPLLITTEAKVEMSTWDDLLEARNGVAADFSKLTESLNVVETKQADYQTILKLQKESWRTVSTVFAGDLANMDNLDKLLTVDKNMKEVKTI